MIEEIILCCNPNVLSSILPFQFGRMSLLSKAPLRWSCTERGTELPDVLLDKTANLLLGGPAHGLQGREFDLHSAKRSATSLYAERTVPSRYLINGTTSSEPLCHPICACGAVIPHILLNINALILLRRDLALDDRQFLTLDRVFDSTSLIGTSPPRKPVRHGAR